MIQDIAPRLYNNTYKHKHPEYNSYLLLFEQSSILLIPEEGGVRFPALNELDIQNTNLKEEAVYLFEIDGTGYYLVENISYTHLSSYVLEDIQSFGTMLPQYIGFAGVTAYQLHRWYCAHRFCGRCGNKTMHDKKERMLLCPECGQMEYPKIAPAVIVGITNGNQLLLSKYADRAYKKYALIAGFAEVGETIEETVKREVMEEVGLKVKNIQYYKSQPWSFTDTLLFGFFAELDGENTIRLDEEELASAEWVEREEIPVSELYISLTNEMIMTFKNGNNVKNKDEGEKYAKK